MADDQCYPANCGLFARAVVAKRLEALEQIRADLTEEKIQVPGVVVIGNQSAGKSSVLEAISGINFPRAQNTCTRRPCVVHLQQDPSTTQSYAYVSENVTFVGSDRIVNMDDVGRQVETLTAQCTEAFSSRPIYVKVVHPRGPTLSLIDLPGITQFATGGNANQNQNVHDGIVTMIESFVQNKEMVILVVVTATEDFGTAEALTIARRHDPLGLRTLGVVTKCDLAPHYSDIRQRIEATRPNDIRLNLGWIGVRCRTPEEMGPDWTPQQVMEMETQLFQRPPFQGIERGSYGMQTLVTRIVQIQDDIVAQFVPKCTETVLTRIQQVKNKLQSMPPTYASDESRHFYFVRGLLELIDEMTSLAKAHDAKGDRELNIAPRTYEMFRKFKTDVESKMPPFLSATYGAIVEKEIMESIGAGDELLSNFTSLPAFKRLLRNAFSPLLMEESHILVLNIQVHMKGVLCRLVKEKFNEFPQLIASMNEVIFQVVDAGAADAIKHVDSIIESELTDAFTQNTHYEDFLEAYRNNAAAANPAAANPAAARPAAAKPAAANPAAADPAAADPAAAKSAAAKPAAANQPNANGGAAVGGFIPPRTVLMTQSSLLAYSEVLRHRVVDVIPLQVRQHVIFRAVKEFGRLATVRHPAPSLEKLMQELVSTKAERERLSGSLERLNRSLELLREL